MEKIELKYRTWFKGVAPRPIKLQIPGWSGENRQHDKGSRPQPWHCPPFVDGSTYGLELIYPFDTECRVKVVDGKTVFEGEWEKEKAEVGPYPFPPFQAFAPGHFGFTSSLDIKAPPGHIIRIEPHPRFYTDETYTCPIPVAGHIQSEWWPKIFFIVFKSPMPGQTYVFRKGEPYAQILVLPRRVSYEVEEMTEGEKLDRIKMEEKIANYNKYFTTNRWTDHVGNAFDDKYRQLSTAYAKDGLQGVHDLINDAVEQGVKAKEEREGQNRSRLGRRIIGVKRINEGLQTDEKKDQRACPFGHS